MDGERMVHRRDALRITAVAGLSAALGGGLWSALARRAGLHRVSDTRTRMGTLVNVTVVHPEADAARRMVEAAFTEMERLEAVLSRYREDSAVARLNREGRLAVPPPDLLAVLTRARAVWKASGGAFDVTMAPLLRLVRESFERTGAPPPDVAVRSVLEQVGQEDLEVDEDRVAFGRVGMSVTLDGIAKGYVVDRVVDVLRARGAGDVLVDAGGDLVAAGDEDGGDGWEVGVQDPRDPYRLRGRVVLRGEGIATSGDYMQSFTPDHAHHHILDPRTGRSPVRSSSVTAVAPTAMDADAWSTAAMVLGPEAGIPLLDGLDGVEGLIVAKDGREVATRGFVDRNA